MDLVENMEVALTCLEIAGKTALSAIPVGGTLATCIWDSIKAHAAQRRLDDWKNIIEDRLYKLENTLEDIGNNEMFASAMMRATDIAIKTAESEKRIYLANAVYNSIKTPLDEVILMIYLDMIDEYTVWHIHILHYFSNPKAYKGVNVEKFVMGSAMEPLLQAFPELKDRKEIVHKIVKDLQTSGLLPEGVYLGSTMSGNGMVAARTTELGRGFLEFVTK